MEIAKIIGNVVATRKDELIEGYKLLMVQALNASDMTPKSLNLVAIDTVDAGVGDIVLIVRGSSARTATGMNGRPVDATIVGIIDEIILDDKSVFKNNGQ
ncbi:EutN/CcmL family microcompartment protein [bacterium]|nr:EutN/CcmL family microcompartment protein [bacterium]